METLNEILINTIQKSCNIQKRYYNSFLLLYRTGCRHCEIDTQRWTQLNETTLKLRSSKYSAERIFTKEEITEYLFDLVVNKDNTQFCLNRKTLTNVFLECSFPYRIFADLHETCLHSFRYNYIKQLKEQNETVEYIKSKVGHKDVKNTLIYYNATITIKTVQQCSNT